MLPIRIKACSESDLRMLGTLARNIQRVLPVTQADIDAAAALGKGWVVWKVIEVTDPIDNLRGGTQLVIKQNSITPGQNVRRVLIVSGPSGQVVVIGPDESPLLLPDAIADTLSYVKAFGGTEQRNIPQPYTQVNYVTNTAQTAVNTGIMIDFAKNYEFEVECRAVSGSWYILQSRASASGNVTGIHGETSGSTIKLVVGNVTICTSAITRTVGNKLYVKATLNAGTATLYVKDETANTEDTQTGSYGTTQPNPTAAVYLLGNAGGQYVDVNSDIYMARIKENGVTVMDYVPARQVATAGFYDKASGTFKTALTPANLSADGNTVPTPDAPMDIVSNNGVLKYSKNLLDMATENIVLGKYINTSGAVSDSGPNFYNSKYIPVVAGGTYTWSTSSSISYFSVMEYDSNYVFKKRTLFSNAGTSGSLTLRSDTAFVLVGSNMDSTDVTLDKIAAVNWQFEKGSSATAYKPYSPTGIYTDGTVETIEDTIGNTATAEMLLKVGNYQDVQSILDGVVTRNVGVKVLDGTENIALDARLGGYGFYFPLYDKMQLVVANNAICSHFDRTFSFSSYNQGIYDTSGFFTENTTKSQFQQYLADQYAAGTPVIVIYPLATPTTESVTGQTLQVQTGDNTLEITQASLSGLELEAEYTKVA